MSNKIKQTNFIAAFVECGRVGDACKVANISRSTLFEWKKKDKEFCERLQEATDLVEDIRLSLAEDAIFEEITNEYQLRKKSGEGNMKSSDYLNFIKTQIQLTKKGKEMLGMVQPIETAQTDVSGGTERLLGELRGILPNPNIPAPRRNLEDLDHFGNPIKKEGENE